MFSKKRYFFVVFEVCLFFFVLWQGLLVDFLWSVQSECILWFHISHRIIMQLRHIIVVFACIEKKGSMHKI